MASISLLIILLVFSALFSGVEIAVFSLSPIKIRHLVEKKKKFAEELYKLRLDPHKLLITILIGNNLVNVGAAAVATKLAIDFFDSHAVGIATGIMTVLILIFGEITPKAFAITHAEKISLLATKPLQILKTALFPIIFLLDLIPKSFGKKTEKVPSISEDELKSIVKVSAEEGSIKGKEREMIHNIFRFDDIEVKEAMTPKKDMFMLDENMRVKDVVEDIITANFSRIPLYSERLDKITGTLYMKDILKYVKKNKLNSKLKEIKMPAFFIPETKKIDSLLTDFQDKKMHIAIVVDEYGGLIGLITIEDLLEEIVGEIYDETDKVKRCVRKTGKNSAIIDGGADIGEVNKKLRLNIKKNNYETISGFILDKTGRIPKEKEKIKFRSFYVEIKEIEGNRISKIKLIKK